jgi:ArsR family transcriptional regulator
VVESMVVEASDRAAQLLSVVADPVRWRIVNELAVHGRRCVCDLHPVAGVAPNVLSYHLRVLREAGLVSASRRGRWMDYELTPDARDRMLMALPALP